MYLYISKSFGVLENLSKMIASASMIFSLTIVIQLVRKMHGCGPKQQVLRYAQMHIKER